MADVMSAITSIFSKPKASWGFNILDTDEEPPMKVETIDSDDDDAVMNDDGGGIDDSDSDIEIISASVVNPNKTSQFGRPDTSRGSPARASDSRVGERNRLKRADSPIELSGDESPRKKTKFDVNGSKQPTSTSTARPGAPRPSAQQAISPSRSSRPNHVSNLSQRTMTSSNFDRFKSPASKVDSRSSDEKRLTGLFSPPKSARPISPLGSFGDVRKDSSASSIRLQPHSRRTPPLPSATPAASNNASNVRTALKLGGTLDHSTPAMFGRSNLNKSHKNASTNVPRARPSISSTPQPQHRTNSRLGGPFIEDDDSDDELFGKESSPSTESTTGAPTPKHGPSEPEFDNIVVAAQPPLSEQTIEKPTSNDKTASKAPSGSRNPSHLDKIRLDSSRHNPTTKRPPNASKVLPAEEKEREVGITMSKNSSSASPLFESHKLPLESELRTHRVAEDSIFGSTAPVQTDTGNRRANTMMTGSRPPDNAKNFRPGEYDDEKRVRQEDSRKKHDDLMKKIQSGAPLQTGGKGDELSSAMTESATPVTEAFGPPEASSEMFVPPKPADDPEARRRREEAANARKQADLRREAEASQRAREKSEAERERWENDQKLLKAQRDHARQRQQQASEEERIFAERNAALSKLSQVKPPSPKPKKPVDGSASLSGLLAAVSNRTETVPLHRADEPHKEANGSLDYGEAPSQGVSTPQEPFQGESVPAATAPASSSQPVDAAREQRIREKKERNERMRAAEKDEEERQLAAEKEAEQRRFQEQQDSQLSRDPGPSLPPKGPVSLNSIAGLRLLAESKSIPRKLGQRPRSGGEERDQRYTRKLGEILPEDIELVKWRDTTPMQWADIARLYTRKYQPRAPDTLRRRYRQVKEALVAAQLLNAQQDSLFSGCEETRLELNRKINGDSFQTVQPSPAQLRDEGEASSASNRPMLHLHPGGTHRPSKILPAHEIETQPLDESLLLQPSQASEDPYDRQSKGGKTMNAEAFRHYLEHIAEEFSRNEEDVDDRAGRESSPFDPDDYAPFTYQVERRELDQSALDDDVTIENAAWMVCGENRDFATAQEANLAAIGEVFRAPEFGVSGVDLRQGREHRTDIDEGMEFHELKGKNGGIRQVRVARYLRSFGKGPLPQNKNGWTPRTVYQVKQRTIIESKSAPSLPEGEQDISSEKTDDPADDPELFGEDPMPEPAPQPKPRITSTRTSETKVEGIYTTLELANIAAVKEFVKTVFSPKSAKLGLRGYEIQEEEERLLKDLDDDEVFYERAEVEYEMDEGQDGEGTFEVWVEEGELRGPRNLD